MFSKLLALLCRTETLHISLAKRSSSRPCVLHVRWVIGLVPVLRSLRTTVLKHSIPPCSSLQPLCGAYTEVARAYGSGKVDVIRQLINKYSETFSSVSARAFDSKDCVPTLPSLPPGWEPGTSAEVGSKCSLQ